MAAEFVDLAGDHDKQNMTHYLPSGTTVNHVMSRKTLAKSRSTTMVRHHNYRVVHVNNVLRCRVSSD